MDDLLDLVFECNSFFGKDAVKYLRAIGLPYIGIQPLPKKAETLKNVVPK
jgi:hypothetical protein